MLDTTSATFGGQTLNTVAFTGQYNDLAEHHFSGSYNDLSIDPCLLIPIEDLTNVDDAVPNDNDVLKYSTSLGRYVSKSISNPCSKCKYTRFKQCYSRRRISSTTQVLKWNGSNWLNGNVNLSEITGKPTTASYGITDALKIGDDYTVPFADDPNHL